MTLLQVLGAGALVLSMSIGFSLGMVYLASRYEER
jgi:hypothetical protein